ncbi:MAG: UDP-N-acetylmuramate--L-alanine ligase [Chitinophagales bacterium]|nr:UDP-N-acetylmuramate--L-alanine ligase [Bacteroidota bacterium]
MNITQLQKVYFIGIGGIGMSALARYLRRRGVRVAGYDKTPSDLTNALISEGIAVDYQEDSYLKNMDAELVVYTPAIKANEHAGLRYFIENDYKVMKRAELLGKICADKYVIAVAGTHGKTTITAWVAHLLQEAGIGCTAFIGGISLNYNTNLLDNNDKIVVVEADEYDRSFLQLKPDIAVITALDADHLDIYGTHQKMLEAYSQFVKNIKPNGKLILHEQVAAQCPQWENAITYGDKIEENSYFLREFSLKEKFSNYLVIKYFENKTKSYNLVVSIAGYYNFINSIPVIAIGDVLKMPEKNIVAAIRSFKGISRRFEVMFYQNTSIWIDDYAHHPQEINQLLYAVKRQFEHRNITVIFQPHLYSRTRDFVKEFAQALNMADNVYLMPIYPAREQAIEGVTSQVIADKLNNFRGFISHQQALLFLKKQLDGVCLTVGAGDIDLLRTMYFKP